MPYKRDATAIIRDWRQVVKHLGVAAVGSPEAERLLDESERLREEYRRLGFEAEGMELPPFPAE